MPRWKRVDPHAGDGIQANNGQCFFQNKLPRIGKCNRPAGTAKHI